MSSSGKVKCTCGWSWNKSDSSKKDMYICHECGRDNSNNMKNGGWLDSYEDGGTMQEHQENYNDNSVSLPEGFVGEGYNTKGRNYSPAWGGQFQMGGSVYPVNYVPEAQMGASIPGAVGFSYARTQSPAPSNGKYAKKTMASAQDGKTFPEFKKIVPKSEEERLRESLKERPRTVVKESIQAPKLPSRKNIKESTLTEKGNVKRDNKGRVVIQNDEGVYTPYQPGVDQVTLTQDNRNTEVKEKLKEYSDAVRNPSMIDKAAFLGELPLNYLSDPTKILGDLGIQGVNDSSEDFDSFVKEVNYPFPASNSLQRGLERQLPKAPSAALNLALASIGTNSLRQTLLEAYNPIPGFDIRHSFGPKRNMITTPSIGRISGDDFDIDLPLNGRNINGIDDAYELNQTSSFLNDVSTPITRTPFQMQELPGLHLQSTMDNGAISKIVEPKSGLINTEQALAIIGKESGGADKVALIKKGLGENIPKKMDYNEFRKTVQDQLIPLERQILTERSDYGINSLGYNRGWKGQFAGQNVEITDTMPLENKTIVFGNKDKFGRGSNAHGNPDETLGHAHYLIDAETPDIINLTQLQSDALQGTHRIMPKTFNPEISQYQLIRRQELQEKNIATLNKMKAEGAADYEIKQMQEIVDAQELSNILEKGHIENFTQKSLLDKNHQERFLQEFVANAAERGDINKVRVPTSETAAKVQNYVSVSNNTIGPNTKKLLDNSSSFDEFLKAKYNEIDGYDFNKEELKSLEKIFNDYKSGTLKPTYEPQHQTILKKYSEQPKLIKKLFGEEPKIVTDGKGNTWYEFDIPKNFKEGKGQIKAFKEGGIIKDDMGQWNHPGEITRISGGNITMKKDPRTGKALTEPLLGIADTGEQQWMYPGEDYNFEGANYVTEIPKRKLAKNGLRQEQKGLQNLDNLLNFTNYNTKQPGGWLEAYK
jgi:hypothetical protein